jgi:transposase
MMVRDVRPLVAQMKDAAGETEAAGILGLPLSVLPNLADHGLIRRLEGAVQGLVPGYGGYHQSSIDELMAKIWSAARSKSGKCCSIMVAARSISAGETPWAAVIGAIIAGDVVIHDTGAQRRNIRFSLAVADIESFVAGVSRHLQGAPLGSKLPHWIAQSTAAELLQVNVAFFSRLANTRPALLPQRGPGYTPYLSSDVQALADTNIFVSEIARRADMHARRVVSWLRSEGVPPCLSLQENRDFGYPRRTVEPLLTELIETTARMKACLGEAADDVRVRLIAAVAAGAGTKATAEAMDVPYRQAKRWVEAWREAGAVAPRKFGYRSKLDDHEDFLRQLVNEQPKIKLGEIQEELTERGVQCSQTAIWNCLERHGIELGGRRARNGTA